MRFSVKKFLISMVVISVTAPILWYVYVGFWKFKTKNLFEKAQNEFVVRYGYEERSNGITQTLVGRSQNEGDKIADYYYKLNHDLKDVEREIFIRGDDTLYLSPIPVPIHLKYVGVKTKLYIKPGDLKNEVVKAYVFNTDCWGYFIAYIPSVNIHESEPPPELYEKFLEYVEKLPKSTSPKFGSLSPYGFYCN
ncbi:hypothetical protein [Cyclobacterium plantarum]|uniref:hypothetical protein n=1 Tax=Cyclobacterium plantarum TaxID=2716263 RepID=UPI003F6FABF0